MPELPEVETVRAQLQHKVIGKTIASVEVFHAKTVGHDTDIEETLVGHTIEDIDRVGKLMIFTFVDEHNIHLLAHLKMTGQFFFIDAAGDISGGGHTFTKADLDMPNKHTRVAFHFTDNSSLYFNDMRLFGYAKVASAQEVATARAKFGPEPISNDFDCAWFVTEIRKRKAPVKGVLLDQSFVAGLGNIYVDEALWRAEVRPTRRANLLTKKEAGGRGAPPAGDIMKESIAVGGTTFKHFMDTGGQHGNFSDYLKVFGKEGAACERCGATIKKIRCAGRGTHYCPGCQK